MKNELTRDNVLDLSLGCISAAETIKEAYDSGYDSLIIPSRGACPIYNGIKNALIEKAKEDPDYEKFLKAVDVPPFLKKHPYIGKLSEKEARRFKIIPYPLTADVHLSENLLNRYYTDLDHVTDAIRKYGAKVISKFLQDPEERLNSDEFTFLLFVHNEVENRKGVADYYKKLNKIKKPILLDTVISGRAMTTVMEALDSFGIDYHAIAIIDREGEKLRKEYRKKIEERERLGKLTQIPVKRIISEDRGASLLGVSACIYPELGFYAKDYADLDLAAAVTWHVISDYDIERLNSDRRDVKKRLNEYKEVYKNYSQTIREGIKLLSEPENNRKKELENLIDKRIDKTLNLIKKYGVLNHEEENFDYSIFVNRRPIKEVYETSSHVIHIFFPDEENKKLIETYIRNYKPRK